MAKSAKIDWDEIEGIYAGILSDMEPVEIFDKDDFERHRLSCLTYGLIPCPGIVRLKRPCVRNPMSRRSQAAS